MPAEAGFKGIWYWAGLTEDELRAVDSWPAVSEVICRSPSMGDHGLIRIRITAPHGPYPELSDDAWAKMLDVIRSDWGRRGA